MPRRSPRLIHLEPAQCVRDVKLKSLFVHFQPKRERVLRRSLRRVRDSATVCHGRFLLLQCGGQRFTSIKSNMPVTRLNDSGSPRTNEPSLVSARKLTSATVRCHLRRGQTLNRRAALARLGGRAELATSFKQMTLQNCTCSVDIPISASL